MYTRLKWGDWNAICDVCGFKYKASMLRKRWDGLMVCNRDWETRHPQDLIRTPKEDQSVPWTTPDDDGIDIEVTYTGAGVQDNTVPSGNFDTNNGTI